MRAFVRMAALGLCASVLVVTTVAEGQTLDTQLSSAQNQANLLDQQVAEASADANRAQRRLDANSPRAQRAAVAAAAALAKVESMETDLAAERTAALEEVNRVESEYEDEKTAHDDAISSGVGFGIGALLLAAVAVFWTRFRQLRFVQRLAEMSWWRAMAIVGGVCLILLILGGAMLENRPVIGALGGFLVAIALGGSASVLIARHSLRVEKKQGRSLISRERFPRWVTVVVAVLLLLLAAVSLGDAISSDEPTKATISAETQALAEAAEGDPLDPPTAELLAARQAAEPLVARAEQLGAAQKEAQAALAQARQSLRASGRQLRRAQLTVSRLSRRVAREVARQQALVAPPPPSGGGGSGGGGSSSPSPSFSTCEGAPSNIPVPPGSPLDGDDDGIGCES